MTQTLLEVRGLRVEFPVGGVWLPAVRDLSFTLDRGEALGLVGESGSGKSVTALAILGILPPAARVTGGRAYLRGVDLLALLPQELARRRGHDLSMVFQSPRTALNPIRTVGLQLEDVLVRHTELTRRQARARAVELLGDVQIPDPAGRAGAYPFELSGGMCQRVMIALAVACAPALLIADEPTTGLDVTTQAEILDLLQDLARRHATATVLITHDLGLAAERCDRIVAMHAGHVVEIAPARRLFAGPRHPYTAALVASTPEAGRALADLRPVPGGAPDLRAALPACRYRGRCPRAAPACDEPPLPRAQVAPDHLVACRFPL